MGFADMEKNKSNNNLIKDLKNKFGKNLDDKDISQKIQEEKEFYQNSNIGQNEFINRLEQKQQEAEQNKDNDKAKMYSMAIAFLKDLWAKKMSEAQQKMLKYVVEQKAKIQMAEYLKLSEQQKIQITAKTLIENLKRQEVMKYAKSIAKDNKKLVQASKKAFGMVGNNIVNQFNFQDKQQGSGMSMTF